LTGGGARSAYQAGVLRALARRFPSLRPDVLTGVSAGALNAAFLASTAREPFAVAADRLVKIWQALEAEHVYRVDRPTVMQAMARLVRRPPDVAPPAEGGFLDTTPLQTFVEGHFGPVGSPIESIDRSVREGDLGAFALTTTSYTTGQSVTWVQGEGFDPWDRPMRRAVRTQIRPEHILASAALPFFFPAVAIEDERVGAGWYGDGGIRLTAPLSPAVHLGADKILAITTRYRQTAIEAAAPKLDAYPPPTRMLGILMNAVFLDVIDQDAQTLRRVNALVEKVPAKHRGALRPVELLVIRPSKDLGALAGDFEPLLPPSMRLVTGGLSNGDASSPDWLSMLLFHPSYVERLVELGEADVEHQLGTVAAFLGVETPTRPVTTSRPGDWAEHDEDSTSSVAAPRDLALGAD
ncbi:patatin-like phospholipase family protein, partial [Rubrivirga sp.]|uniref:patatin-like phospholipase family protein n=1 Tax=Rubrivirga sp. TaxID=1885344 RepID=UPI003C788B29